MQDEFDMDDGIPANPGDSFRTEPDGGKLTLNEQTPLQLRILELIISEPAIKKSEIAKRLGKNPATIGLIIKSDLFQDRLRTMQQKWEGAIYENLQEQMHETALQAVEKMRSLLAQEYDLGKVATAAKTLLGGLGYHDAKGAVNQTNVSVHLPADVFARAQRSFGQPAALIEGKVVGEE